MRFKAILLVIVAGAVLGLLAWAFLEGRKELATERERERPVAVPSRLSVEGGESVITLDTRARLNSGIRVAPLQPVSHKPEFQAYGTVLPLQELIDLRSNYTAAQAQLEKARASLEASRKEFDRLRGLHRDNRNISDKALQSAEAAWRTDEASARAAQEALNSLQNNGRQRWGSVLASAVWEGSQAWNRLLQQQDLLIQITLPAGARISSAPQAARVQAADGALTTATLVSPAPRTDPRLQGTAFFYTAPAKTSGLLPGMNVLAYLPAGAEIKGFVIPASAVVWWQGNAWAYVEKATGRYVRYEVPTDSPLSEGWFAAKGFAVGERIVMSGAQLLLSEEFRSQIQVGEEGGGE